MVLFNPAIRRVLARAEAVILEDVRGVHSPMQSGRTVRAAEGLRLFLEPARIEWYEWAAFRSWRSKRSHECRN